MTPMRTATCVCGGEIVTTVYGYGHLQNPGHKHHRPTPRRSPEPPSSSRATFGVPEPSPLTFNRQLNKAPVRDRKDTLAQSTGTPLHRHSWMIEQQTGHTYCHLCGQHKGNAPCLPASGGVGARGLAPSVPPDASAGRSTAK